MISSIYHSKTQNMEEILSPQKETKNKLQYLCKSIKFDVDVNICDYVENIICCNTEISKTIKTAHTIMKKGNCQFS
jgi:hypothetical protein